MDAKTSNRFVFIFNDRLPGLNEYTAACRKHPKAGASMKKKAENKLRSCIRDTLKDKHVGAENFGILGAHVTFIWKEPNRKRDKDNIAFAKKFVLDALVKEGVLENDGWSGVVGFTDQFELVSKAEGHGVVVVIDW